MWQVEQYAFTICCYTFLAFTLIVTGDSRQPWKSFSKHAAGFCIQVFSNYSHVTSTNALRDNNVQVIQESRKAGLIPSCNTHPYPLHWKHSPLYSRGPPINLSESWGKCEKWAVDIIPYWGFQHVVQILAKALPYLHWLSNLPLRRALRLESIFLRETCTCTWQELLTISRSR